jgi:hypothetical protein
MGAMMKKLLEEAAKLSPDEQESWAATCLSILEDERGWSTRFERHPEVLERLVAEADAEIESGRVGPMDFDKRST